MSTTEKDEYDRGYLHCYENFIERLNALEEKLDSFILLMEARDRVAKQST